MSRLKTTVSMLGAGALALSLAACGGDDSQSYCDLLENSESEFTDLDPSDPESHDQVQSALSDIVEAAPDDIKDDWQTFADTYEEMVSIDPNDQEAMAEFQENSAADFQEASARIGDNVQEECDMEMSGL